MEFLDTPGQKFIPNVKVNAVTQKIIKAGEHTAYNKYSDPKYTETGYTFSVKPDPSSGIVQKKLESSSHTGFSGKTEYLNSKDDYKILKPRENRFTQK